MQEIRRMGRPALSASVWEALAQPAAFPGDVSASAGVDWVQTHLSHVYLTGERVYKFRKPVDLGFVDFSTLDERNADCLREVALNRRLASDVYLGVAALEGPGSDPHVGRASEDLTGSTAEHCVVMRRLPAGRDALSLLEGGKLTSEMLDAVAARIARFHAENQLGRPAPFSTEAWRERCTRPVEENFRILADAPGELVPRDLLSVARTRAERFVARHADRFEARRLQGRAVDGHGDLHLQHVWWEGDSAEPLVIDCLEFSEALRTIDVASEVAFLAMDLRYRGATGLAEHFLRSYARDRDDFELYSVVDYFTSYRAGVRAKVAAIAARDPGLAGEQRSAAEQSARRHLALAADVLDARRAPAVVLIAGIVGTGKSSVAAELAQRLDAVVVAADRVRKHLHGVAPTDRLLSGGWDRGAYSSEQRARVYAGLLERARPVLESGRAVVLDATFSRREHRDAVSRLAGELGIPAFAVEVRCRAELVRARLARRRQEGNDPSDAGPEALAPSTLAFEALDEWPDDRRGRLSTHRADWRSEAERLAERIRAV